MDMSKEEFLEKHGDVILTFSSYYKYAFSYTAELGNGEKIYASIGGCSDDIYRLEVKNNEQVKLRDLDPDSAYFYNRNGAQYGFYGY
ncbi:MAG: hypothetical protein MI867_30140 [Pseudomonadales bacterium]|nr:hypothetical protein [Pseudomonadales bacterium]